MTVPCIKRERFPIFIGFTHTQPSTEDFTTLFTLCNQMIIDADRGVNPYLKLPNYYRALLLDLYPGGPQWEYAVNSSSRVAHFRSSIRRVQELINKELSHAKMG